MAWLVILFFLLYGEARSLNFCVWLHFFYLPPYTEREKPSEYCTYCFCRRRESNPGRLRSKRVRYPLLHCLSASHPDINEDFLASHQFGFYPVILFGQVSIGRMWIGRILIWPTVDWPNVNWPMLDWPNVNWLMLDWPNINWLNVG